MKNLNYYRELLQLIEDKSSQVDFVALYKASFGTEPTNELIKQFNDSVQEKYDEDADISYESSYESSYEEPDSYESSY